MTDNQSTSNPLNALSNRKTLLQLLRYGVVGVLNTLLTLFVIYILKSFFDVNPWISNACGYVAGFINSFIWNKLWVFRSTRHYLRESIMFGIGFLICYGLQFVVTWFLTNHTPLGSWEFTLIGLVFSGYGVATLLGMVIYTLANFIYNRLVTFTER